MGDKIKFRNNLLKPLCFAVVCLLLSPCLTPAGEPALNQSGAGPASSTSLSGYIETGQRSQSEDFEEEDEDREYSYQNYHLKLKQQLPGSIKYEFGSFIYNKDYRSQDSLDNISRVFNIKLSYGLRRQKKEVLALDIKLKYKTKRYRNTPANEYDQVLLSPKLTYTRKGSFAVSLNAGINNYDYLSVRGNDQLKVFAGLGAKKYMLEKKLTFKTSYKLEMNEHKRSNRRKNKNAFTLAFDYIFDYPLLHKLSSGLKSGQRETKDFDERDEDFDYKYRRFFVRTDHRPTSRLTNNFKYQYFKKDYSTSRFDHSGFYISAGWTYSVLTDKIRALHRSGTGRALDLRLSAEHKDVDYSIRQGSNYKKETVGIKTTYRKKKDWTVSVSFTGNFYDYSDPAKDKNRYYTLLFFEKLLPEKDLSLSLNFKYRYTDHKQANNTEEETVRLAFKYKF